MTAKFVVYTKTCSFWSSLVCDNTPDRIAVWPAARRSRFSLWSVSWKNYTRRKGQKKKKITNLVSNHITDPVRCSTCWADILFPVRPRVNNAICCRSDWIIFVLEFVSNSNVTVVTSKTASKCCECITGVDIHIYIYIFLVVFLIMRKIRIRHDGTSCGPLQDGKRLGF